MEGGAGGMGPAQLLPWGSLEGQQGGWRSGVLWGESGSCLALTMELALHTSRVTVLRCCFSRVMAG